MAQARMPTLSDLIAQFQTVQVSQEADKAKVDVIQGQYDEATRILIDETLRTGNLAQQAETAKGQLELDKAARNQRSAAEFGTNPDAQTYVRGELAARYIDGQIGLAQSAVNLQRKMQLGFSDDPLTWIVQQFTLPREVNAHNAKVAEQQIVSETINEIQNKTIQAAAINATLDANTSIELMNISGQIQLSKAQQEAAKAAQAAAGVNLNIVGIRGQLTQQGYQNALALNKAGVEQQQLAISRAQLAVSQANLGLNYERYGLEAAAEQRRADLFRKTWESDEKLQRDLNIATATFGMRDITPEMFRQMSGPIKDRLSQAMMDPFVQQGRLGANPVLSVANADFMNAPLSPGTQHTKRGIQAMIEIAKSEAGASWLTMKPEDKTAFTNKVVKREMDKELRNVPDEHSIFSAPPLQAVGKLPGVAASQLWRTVLGPLATNEFIPTRVNDLYTLTVKAIVDGRIGLVQAQADYAAMYQAIVADNHHSRNYGLFSSTLDPKLVNSYTTRVSVYPGSPFSNPKNLDHTNEAQVGNSFLRDVNAERTRGQFRELYGPKEGEVK